MSRATAVVTFDRIGRNHVVPSVSVESDDAQHIAEAVYAHARRYLGSRDVNVAVDFETEDAPTGTCHIFAGFHRAGTGTVTIIRHAEAQAGG